MLKNRLLLAVLCVMVSMSVVVDAAEGPLAKRRAARMAAAASAQVEPTDFVNPFIGTNEHGHTFPGATVPFGMVQLSPDTRLESWDGCSGYHYSDPNILGFSHTHLSGTGCPDLGDIRLTPLSGTIPAQEKDGYRLRYSHDAEVATPGYYSVAFSDTKVKAELTATAHAGFHRYQFPAGQPAYLALDIARGISDQPIEGQLTVEKNTVLSGYRRSAGWSPDHTFFFVIELSRPFDACKIDVDGKPVAADARDAKGKAVQAIFDFKDAKTPLLIKVGLSPVSVENARKNLAAEIPAWDFDGTVAAAKKQWNAVLSKIDIEPSDSAQRETFYTALYHACMAPTLFNDADGSYMGADHKPHPFEGFQNYCTFSLWDTFRAENPLLTIVQPQRIDDFIASMLAHYNQFGQHSLPVWSLAGCETWCMIGNHAIPVIVDAFMKGFHRYDVEAVYQAMRDTVMQDRVFLNEYREKGYIPSGEQKESVARTVECAFDDWCISQMARKLDKKDDAELFAKRGANYRNVFDPAVGFVRGRMADGSWREPFDPTESQGSGTATHDFTEGTAWNYTFFVPQDPHDLVKMLGGDDAFNKKLDAMFTGDSKPKPGVSDMTGLIGQYVHGNEPCHHIAYLYAYAGTPWKTQKRVREIMDTLYNNTPGGQCGNDDCGQMSAWYVLSSMGFYSVNPASSVYVIGSPVVNKATIHLDPKFYKGKTFTIIAENNSPKNVYVQSATLNGKPLERCWFSHNELTAGGTLVLKMGPEPNVEWAKAAEKRPPLNAYAK